MEESQSNKVKCKRCGRVTTTDEIPPVLSGAFLADEDPNINKAVCEHCGLTTTWGPEDIIS